MVERYGIRYVIFRNAVVERYARSGRFRMPTIPMLDRMADELLPSLNQVPLNNDFPSIVEKFVDDITDQAMGSFAGYYTISPVNREIVSFLFITADTYDALVGDLEERYIQICKTSGNLRGSIWYWTQALRSFGSIMLVATKKLFGCWRR